MYNKDRFEFKELKRSSVMIVSIDQCVVTTMSPSLSSLTCLVSPGLPLQEISAPALQSLTTPSLESRKQTSAQARFIGGPIIKKMTSHIYKCLASCSDVSWLSYAQQEESFSRDNLIRSLSPLSALRIMHVRYILGMLTLVTLN